MRPMIHRRPRTDTRCGRHRPCIGCSMGRRSAWSPGHSQCWIHTEHMLHRLRTRACWHRERNTRRRPWCLRYSRGSGLSLGRKRASCRHSRPTLGIPRTRLQDTQAWRCPSTDTPHPPPRPRCTPGTAPFPGRRSAPYPTRTCARSSNPHPWEVQRMCCPHRLSTHQRRSRSVTEMPRTRRPPWNRNTAHLLPPMAPNKRPQPSPTHTLSSRISSFCDRPSCTCRFMA